MGVRTTDRAGSPAGARPRHSPGRGSAAPPPFERVIEAHGRALLRFCAARAGADRAEDVFQETMLAALRAYEQVRDPGQVRSWLFSIAARKAIDSHRAEARAPRPVEDPAPASDAADEITLLDEAVWEPVRALPDKQREAVTLRFLGDLSHREIAAVMETSEAAARRNVFEALRRLRDETDGSSIADRSHDRRGPGVQRP
jgi:RNA polymerase sigma factor (sigma-70 family)